MYCQQQFRERNIRLLCLCNVSIRVAGLTLIGGAPTIKGLSGEMVKVTEISAFFSDTLTYVVF